MTVGIAKADKIAIANEIFQLRKELQRITMDEHLSDGEKVQIIYKLMPTTRDKYIFLILGDAWHKIDEEDIMGEWQWGFNDTEYNRLQKDIPKKVSPQVIMDKFTIIVRDNPIDLDGIIASTEHDIDKFVRWNSFYHYMDADLLPPEPEGDYGDGLNEKEQQRADEFQRFLRGKSEDFLIRFMLMAGFDHDFYINVPVDATERMYAGKAISYAEGAIYNSFPAWYRQWNRLVPTMCVRRSGLAEQDLCPDPRFSENAE